MKTKLLSLFILLSSVLTGFPSLAANLTFVIDGIKFEQVTPSVDDKSLKAAVIANDVTPYSGDIVIPDVVEFKGKTYIVTNIKDDAFRNCTLNSVSVPGSVTFIGFFSFNLSKQIKSIIFEDGSKTLSLGSSYDYKHSDDDDPDHLHGLWRAPLECNGLETLYIGRNVDSCYDEGREDFYESVFLSSANNVTIGNMVTALPIFAFRNCRNITEIKIPASLKQFGEGAFKGCSGLKKVDFESIDQIATSKFYNADANPINATGTFSIRGTEITELKLSTDITGVCDYAFSGARNIISLSLPSSLATIGKESFHGCNAITKIEVFRKNPPLITETSFDTETCNRATLYIPEGSLSDYKNPANNYWANFVNIEEYEVPATDIFTFEVADIRYKVIVPPIDYNGNMATVIEKEDGGYSGDVVIPSTVEFSEKIYDITEINNDAFHDCSLNSLTVAGSVTNIGYYAFDSCNLKKLILEEGEKELLFGNISEESDRATPRYSDTGSVISPFDKTGLTDVSIDRNISSFLNGSEGDFFESLFPSSLKNVSVGPDVTSLPAFSFNHCNALTEITIPASLKEFGEGCFADCKSLSVARFESVDQIATSEFQDADANPINAAGKIYIGDKELTELFISDSVTKINDYAFIGAKDVTTVNIASTISRIGKDVFTGCSSIKAVYSFRHNPPRINGKTFDDETYLKATLYVPVFSSPLYKSENTGKYWSDFKTIKEFNATEIQEIRTDEFAIGSDDQVEIFNMEGVRLFYGKRGDAQLPAGIYLIRKDNHIIKELIH